MKYCPKCSKVVAYNESSCQNCNEQLGVVQVNAFCRKCNAELKKDGKFCPLCGEMVIDDSPPPPPESPPPPRKKKRWLFVLVSIGLSVVVTAGFLFGITLLNPNILGDTNISGIISRNIVDEIIEALENEDFTEAIQLAWELEDEDNDALSERLGERLQIIHSGFMDEAIEYSIAIMELDTIERMGFRELVARIDNVRGIINLINDSRIAFNTAEAMYEQGNYIAAMAHYRLVVLEDPNFSAAQEGMERTIIAYRSQIEGEVENHIMVGDYLSAMQTLENALQIVEADPGLTEMLNHTMQRHVNTSIVNAENAAVDGAFIEAKSIIRSALLINPENEELLQKLSEIIDRYAIAVIVDVDALVEQGYYREAVVLINDTFDRAPENVRLLGRRAEIRETYVEVAIREANTMLGQLEHDAAANRINTALQTFAGDDELRAKRAVIDAARPVSIRELTSLDARLVESLWHRDNFMGEYTDVVNFSLHWGRSAFYSLLDSRYSRLRGTLFIGYGASVSSLSTKIEFELDGLVTESHVMTYRTRPISIDIDLSNVTEFRIISDIGGSAWGWGPVVNFAYFRLYP